jgi:hypothetical protein
VSTKLTVDFHRSNFSRVVFSFSSKTLHTEIKGSAEAAISHRVPHAKLLHPQPKAATCSANGGLRSLFFRESTKEARLDSKKKS